MLSTSVQLSAEVTEEYRLLFTMDARIADRWSSGGVLAFFEDPDAESQTYRVEWPNVTYIATRWLQLSGGLLTQYTDDHDGANTLELRPFAGVKLFVPNKLGWTLYNYTRYEYRDIENLDTSDWDQKNRIRSLFAAELPLTSRERAWKPKTWYALAGAEPFYEFETNDIDQLRLSIGLGRVFTDRLRVEFTYYANLTRPTGSGLAHTENMFQLNFRLGLHEGILRALHSPFAEREEK